MSNKLISKEKEWDRVSKELKLEKIKIAYYDNTIIPLLGNIKNKKILDYGGGQGILAIALKKLGADVKIWDISNKIRKQAAKNIGKENIYNSIKEIPEKEFDFIICNLVLCINSDKEVKKIVKNIKDELNEKGLAYIGFCNPKLLGVPESNLDFRPKQKQKYEKNHSYIKTKKEGMYKIIENHRPIEWYEKVYEDAGLILVDTFFTPEYELNGRKIKDFIIFKLKKG